MRDAEEILDCKVEGCGRACPACVLVGDLSDEEVGRLDRRPALALVRDRLLVDASPEDDDRAFPDARFSVDTLDEIRRALEAGATEVVFYVAGGLDPAELSGWPAIALARQWSARGRRMILALPLGAIDRLNGAQKVQLRDQVHAWGIELYEGDQPVFANGARRVAEVRRPTGPALVFASRDEGASTGSSAWGKPGTAPIVRAEAPMAWAGQLVGLDRLRETPGASLVDIRHDFDGPIAGFGERLSGMIAKVLADLGVPPEDGAVELTYEDRYLKSPAVLRLCMDTLAKLPRSGPGPLPLNIKTFPLVPPVRPTNYLDSDWRRDDDRIATATSYAAACGMRLDVELTHPEHGRRLTIKLKSGRVAEIVLDQGFGAWRNDRGVAFDFSRPAPDQARRLASIGCGVRVPPGARTYLVATLR